jgi:hypothetical protein
MAKSKASTPVWLRRLLQTVFMVICQNKCPVPDQAAIRVTSAGETRNFKNQFLAADRYSG